MFQGELAGIILVTEPVLFSIIQYEIIILQIDIRHCIGIQHEVIMLQIDIRHFFRMILVVKMLLSDIRHFLTIILLLTIQPSEIWLCDPILIDQIIQLLEIDRLIQMIVVSIIWQMVFIVCIIISLDRIMFDYEVIHCMNPLEITIRLLDIMHELI